MKEYALEVGDLDWEMVPPGAKWRLSRARKKQRTGILLYVVSRAKNVDTVSSNWRIAILSREGRTLCGISTQSPFTKFVPLPSGLHRIRFDSAGNYGAVDFFRNVLLGERDVLVARCQPGYSWKPFDRNRPPERWHLGVLLDGEQDFSPVTR
ncbi:MULTISPECIES: hypothetical protein [Actinosynnema]|uniref:hypothetical protein n=1 Tax=Actinosynnema TaxID=40566 RepID=UPI0020A3C824|nr:hypothetical protein [Actinosynnema pretiosum]MCP2098784.1 hypothetical protein [Actinosynnema pretiosum]